jgi:NitT/TauT family transport system permease protein
MATPPAADQAATELAGLDALDIPVEATSGRAQRVWRAAWPKLAALAIVLAGWQLLDTLDVKPDYVLPGPVPVFAELMAGLGSGELVQAVITTMRRMLVGFGAALGIGVAIGLAVTRSAAMRAAVGSLITGLQTMPSIAWFPFAILLFGISETAIFFVVVLGAAPAIANGLISGIDHIPRILLKAGWALGARRLARYRYIVLPASLPGFVAGLKQGWAFAWRSLLAGELLVIITSSPALGTSLQFAREVSDAEGMLATMVVILAIGIIVDGLVFGRLELAVRRRWGLLKEAR